MDRTDVLQAERPPTSRGGAGLLTRMPADTDVQPHQIGVLPRQEPRRSTPEAPPTYWARTTANWSAVVVSAVLLVLVTIPVVLNAGALVALDVWAHEAAFEERWPAFSTLADFTDHVGLRWPTALMVVIAAALLARRTRSLRPLLVTGVALLTLNVVVGAAKIGFGRGKPSEGITAMFEGGMMYPSGHAANVVLTWGLLSYLLVRYGTWRHRQREMIVGVAALSLLMGVTSVYRDTHWVTDLVAGWLFGLIILQLVILADLALSRVEVPMALLRVRQRTPETVRRSSAA